MKIISVVGARPNFIKIAPFIRAIEIFNNTDHKIGKIKHILVHTGQHYDDRMSNAFFTELNIPQADINLGVGSGTHAQQVGQTMIEFEKVIQSEKPDWVVVVGDVNATLSCSVTAKKELIKLCHIEAGLRSGDMSMPEEINRLVTDRLSDLLLTPDKLSIDNLLKEGIDENKIKFVGNIMIDTLETNLSKAILLNPDNIINENLYLSGSDKVNGFSKKKYAILTLHRPSNVDRELVLNSLVQFFTEEVINDMNLVWVIHPRTEKNLKTFGLWNKIINTPGLYLLNPLGYLEMLKLNTQASIMLTDSGGLQEECTILGTPCLTLRWNTERPITLKENGGASVLVGNNIEKIRKEYKKTLTEERKPNQPELWDGKTAERCLNAIIHY